MNTIEAGNLTFAVGQCIALAFLIYGAFLCMSVWKLRTPCGLDEGRPSDATVRALHALLNEPGTLTALKRGAYAQSALLLLGLWFGSAPQPVRANDAFAHGIEAFQPSRYPAATSQLPHAAISQPRKAECSTIAGGILGYAVFDQSAQSERLYQEMKSLACPHLVAINQVQGNFSAGPARAERHPLAFVFEATGKVRQFDDPKAFIAAVNARTRSTHP